MDQRQGPRIAVRRVLEKEHWCTAMRCIPSTSEEGEDCDHLPIQNTSALGRPLGMVDKTATSSKRSIHMALGEQHVRHRKDNQSKIKLCDVR